MRGLRRPRGRRAESSAQAGSGGERVLRVAADEDHLVAAGTWCPGTTWRRSDRPARPSRCAGHPRCAGTSRACGRLTRPTVPGVGPRRSRGTSGRCSPCNARSGTLTDATADLTTRARPTAETSSCHSPRPSSARRAVGVGRSGWSAARPTATAATRSDLGFHPGTGDQDGPSAPSRTRGSTTRDRPSRSP